MAKAIKDNYDTMTKSIPGLYKLHELMRTYFDKNKKLTSSSIDDTIINKIKEISIKEDIVLVSEE